MRLQFSYQLLEVSFQQEEAKKGLTKGLNSLVAA